MKTYRKILAVIMCVVITLSAAPLGGLVGLELPSFFGFDSKAIEVTDAAVSGTYGANLTWRLDIETGTLDIVGTGEMTNWESYTSIPWYSYRNDIKTVNIGDGITSVRSYAFCSCENLVNITIPNSVTIIGEGVFDNCRSLVSITMPNSITSIDTGVFSNCTSLTSVEIPSSVTSIGMIAFANCISLTSVEIPGSVTDIGESAFEGCRSLKSITIPGSVASIGPGVFANCTALSSVTIPKSVTSIDSCAFSNCNNLTDVYYEGSASEWNIISIATDNEPLTSATIHFTDPPHTHLFTSTVTVSATCTKEGVLLYTCDCGDSYTEIIPRKEHTAGEWEIVLKPTIEADGKKIKKCKVCGTPVEEQAIEKITEPEFDEEIILTPSQSTINYGDSIVLHIDVEIIPEGGYVEWTASNGNFAFSVSMDGSTCKITPSVSGDTTFTAVVYDEDGRPIFTDKQVMTSKAGFFQKFISFFKNLFGISRIILQSI